MKKLLQYSFLSTAVLTAGLLSTSAFAASPTWDFVELEYVQLDVDDGDFDPKGINLTGVKLISDNIFLAGTYTRTSEDVANDEIDYDTFDLGLGYKYSISSTTDWYSTLSYFRVEAENRNTSIEEDGYAIATGLRSMLTDKFELAGEISYADIDVDDQTTFGIKGTYYVSDNFGVNLGYSASSDVDTVSLGVRYSF